MIPPAGLITDISAELAEPAFLLEVVLKGTLILTLALLAGRVWHRASASARHLVLGLAIGGTLLLPLLVLVAPTWEVAPLPALDTEWRVENVSPIPPATPEAIDPVTGSAGELTHTPVFAKAPRSIPWATWLTCVWITGAALVTLRLLIALLVVGRILRKATPAADRRLLAMSHSCRKTIGLGGRIPLLLSKRAAVPFAWGWLRPRIILPADCDTWSDRKLEIVLLHEMAHIKRWDTFSTGVAQLAAIVYWFNPLLWLARRQLLVERECASDDCVLGTGIRASEYAGCLVDIARVIQGHRWLPELQVAVARKNKLEERIMAIVTGQRRRSRYTGRRTVLAGVVLSLLLIIPLASFQIFAQDNRNSTDANTLATKVGVPATPAELDAVKTVLNGFHEALYAGDDYEDIRDRYLAADYFGDPRRTFENWTQQERDGLMNNTIAHIQSRWKAPEGKPPETLTINGSNLVYRAETLDCRKHGGEVHLTQRVNIASDEPADSRRHLVQDLVHTVVFTEENGRLRISRYDGGVNIHRMDIDNPCGPIFIVTLDGDEASIPTGPLLFKSVPRSIVPNNLSVIPLRADKTDR